ncbi:hypothetical protein [Anaerolentibacter hominis]|uniref:hypothetical protein n=1 Tax=Anaerolentibacter hominis TaxID=3079009 RepID=UPI0031B89427
MKIDNNVIKEKIADAEYVVVGIGRELAGERLAGEAKVYEPLESLGIRSKAELDEQLQDTEKALWIHRILLADYFQKRNPAREQYAALEEMLKGKDYFIVTTNTDACIYQSSLEEEKIVAPCGDIRLFQCLDGCGGKIWQEPNYLEGAIALLREGKLLKVLQERPFCPECNSPVSFHMRDKSCNYIEGYLPQWNCYKEWLQHTLNRKLVLVELGENFDQPTVFRWPFEKIAYFNQKAYFVRVNQMLHQIPEEVTRALAVKANAAEWLTAFVQGGKM